VADNLSLIQEERQREVDDMRTRGLHRTSKSDPNSPSKP
jgi:hypothetical protein